MTLVTSPLGSPEFAQEILARTPFGSNLPVEIADRAMTYLKSVSVDTLDTWREIADLVTVGLLYTEGHLQ